MSNLMEELTHGHGQQRMETYAKANAENDPQTSTNLFAQDATYYETPLAEPCLGAKPSTNT
jgi:hypothetical protein